MAGTRVRQFNLALVVVALLLSFMSVANGNQQLEQNKECVILLHGLARSKTSMRPIEHALQNRFQVYNQGYPSRRHDIKTLANMAIEPALEACIDAPKIHFVTHSLGGILLREFLSTRTISNIGHVVMLGPPNQGSELVDYFQSSNLGRWLFNNANGPAGEQLGTQGKSHPRTLGAVNFSLGVIAGNKSYNPIFSRVIDGEDDGKVSVASSKVDGMADHIVLPTSHTFMMRNRDVIDQIEHFLANGKFSR